MQLPEVHRDYHRERHADLLREARQGDLAAAMARGRRVERRSYLARLWRKRTAPRPAPSAS